MTSSEWCGIAVYESSQMSRLIMRRVTHNKNTPNNVCVQACGHLIDIIQRIQKTMQTPRG